MAKPASTVRPKLPITKIVSNPTFIKVGVTTQRLRKAKDIMNWVIAKITELSFPKSWFVGRALEREAWK